MRASATSRLASPAHLPAARADNNTAKSDEASPFALLVGAAIPPAQKSDHAPSHHSEDQSGQDKASADQPVTQATSAPQQTAPANSGQQAAQPADNQAAQPSDNGGQDDASQDDVQAASEPNAAPAAQAEQDCDPAVAAAPVAAATDNSAASDEDTIALWPQSGRLPSQPVQSAKSAKSEKSDKKEHQDQQDQPDSSAQVATDQLAAELQPLAVAIAAPQASTAGTPNATTSDTTAPAIQPAAQTAAPQAGAAGMVGQTAAPSLTAAPPAEATSADDTDAAAPQDGAVPANNTQPAAKNQAKPAALKPDTAGKLAKAGDLKTPGKTQQAADPAAVKAAETPAAGNDDDSTKPDAAKPAAPAPDVTSLKTTGNGIALPAVGQLAAPQIQAPAFTQHIQVTAQPQAANLPALAVEIAAKSQSGAKQFDIRLDPPELGRVEVRLSIDATGKASAHLSADQPQTLNLLQKDAPALTRALRDAGLDVAQNGLNFSLRQQAGHDGGANANPGRGSARNFSLTATTSIEPSQTSAAYYGRGDGGLDIRV